MIQEWPLHGERLVHTDAFNVVPHKNPTDTLWKQTPQTTSFLNVATVVDSRETVLRSME